MSPDPVHSPAPANANTTTNWTSTVGAEPERQTLELVIGTFTYLVILLMTVLGNSLVVISVFNYRPLKKVQNYFIVSLAAADVAVSTLVMPFHIVKFLLGGRWMFGLAVCQMWLTFDILCCTASILNLVAIALDRYWAITQPMEYAQKRTLRLVVQMIVGVWCVSALIAIPPLIGFNDWSGTQLRDRCELNSDLFFVVFSSFGSFFIPLTVMATVYVKIFLAARKRLRHNRDRSAIHKLKKTTPGSAAANNAKEERRPLFGATSPEVRARLQEMVQTVVAAPIAAATTTTNVTTMTVATTPDGDEESDGGTTHHDGGTPQHRPQVKFTAGCRPGAAGGGVLRLGGSRPDMAVAPAPAVGGTSAQSMVKRKEMISVSKEKKAAKTLAVIMGVFVLCWMPFFLMYLLTPFCQKIFDGDACYIHPKVENAVTWLGYINSAINPVIYTIFNMDFRRAFERYLCPTKGRQRRRFSHV